MPSLLSFFRKEPAASRPLDVKSAGAKGSPHRFLDPVVLATLGSLDLIARAVVDGFVAGLHRSPDFGFSQEFAEYRAYTPGDDMRHVDWNLYARTERMYLKRYRGETNSQLTVLLDASNSMLFGSGVVKKIDYARFLCASFLYLAIRHQRDAAGLIVFDDQVREYVRPSTRQGQLPRLFASLNAAEPSARTNFGEPLAHFQRALHRRGIVLVVSDFYEDPDVVVRTIEPLRYTGNEVVLLHILDREELRLKLNGPALLEDLESGQTIEVVPEYAKTTYRERIDAHVEALRSKTRAAGMDYRLLVTDEPLDSALREYLTLRQAGN